MKPIPANPPTGRGPGRPSDRQDQIVEELRALIVGGTLAPGDQLPTRVAIEERYSSSTATVQRALDRLKRDGFIVSSGRNGTHVAPHPPHLTRYALVFSQKPTIKAWSRYWTALQNEAQQLATERGCELPLYFGMDGRTDNPDFVRLLAEVRDHRVSGLIFPDRPYLLENTPLWQTAGMPRVVAGHDVDLDMTSFWSRACRHLADLGKKRVALLTFPLHERAEAIVVEQIRAHRLQLQDYWWQMPNRDTPMAARHAAQLLFSGASQERPDALIIADDNMVEAGTAGLLAAGAERAAQVAVVAHCNFPWPAPAAVPVQYLGFHARHILMACIESIDRQRHGAPTPSPTKVESQFDFEIAAAGFATGLQAGVGSLAAVHTTPHLTHPLAAGKPVLGSGQ